MLSHDLLLQETPVGSTRLRRSEKILDGFAHRRDVVIQYVW